MSGEKLLLLKCSIKFVVLPLGRVADEAAELQVMKTESDNWAVKVLISACSPALLCPRHRLILPHADIIIKLLTNKEYDYK